MRPLRPIVVDEAEEFLAQAWMRVSSAGPSPSREGEGRRTRRDTLRGEFLRIINHDRVTRSRAGALDAGVGHGRPLLPRADPQRHDRPLHHRRPAPYMRYSFAGGNDGVSENAAAWSANYASATARCTT